MHFRRRRFLIDGRLQFRLMAASIGYVAFYILVMAVATFIPLICKLRHLDPNSYQASVWANQFMYLHWHIWPVALAVLAVVSVHSIWLSHRVAGPLYRFRRIFRDLAAGKLPGRQNLRRRDYLQAEMAMINEVLDAVRERALQLRQSRETMAAAVARVAERSRALPDPELHLLVADLERCERQLGANSFFYDEES